MLDGKSGWSAPVQLPLRMPSGCFKPPGCFSMFQHKLRGRLLHRNAGKTSRLTSVCISRSLMVAGYEPQCAGRDEATAGQSARHGKIHMAQTEVRIFPKLACLHRIHGAGEMQTRSDSTASETRVMSSSCVQDSERCPLVPQFAPVSAESRKRNLVGFW